MRSLCFCAEHRTRHGCRATLPAKSLLHFGPALGTYTKGLMRKGLIATSVLTYQRCFGLHGFSPIPLIVRLTCFLQTLFLDPCLMRNDTANKANFITDAISIDLFQDRFCLAMVVWALWVLALVMVGHYACFPGLLFGSMHEVE